MKIEEIVTHIRASAFVIGVWAYVIIMLYLIYNMYASWTT